MSIFAIPALLALCFKFFIINMAIRDKQVQSIFFGLLSMMALHNLSELLVITHLFDGKSSELLLRCYYVAAAFALVYLFLFALEVSGCKNSKPTLVFALSTTTALSAIIFNTNLIIAGAESVGYTVTASKGQLYIVFQAFAVINFLLAMATFIYALRSSQRNIQIRSATMLLATLPIFIASMAVLIAMQLGAPFTAAIVMPIATSLFLYIALKAERDHQFFLIRHLLPFTNESKTLNQAKQIIGSHLNGGKKLKDTVDAIEKTLLEHALRESDDNVSGAAKRLGIHRTTAYNLINKFNINEKK